MIEFISHDILKRSRIYNYYLFRYDIMICYVIDRPYHIRDAGFSR